MCIILEMSHLLSIAKTLRGLSIDGIESAGCGHPGLPLGCADIVAYLYAEVLRHNPKNPNWINRDRFILSAGHGSMLLYAALHLAGFGLTKDDLKNFRKYKSPTAGHPEYNECPGVETTTGPLGQGVATATGMALGHKLMNAQHGHLDANFYVLAGDGDLMEGVSAEAASLAGHLKLDNLILIYDSNDICLDGPTDECFTEDTKARYESYGWFTIEIDGHDLGQIGKAITAAQKAKKPSLIIAKTKIGFGSPNLEGTNEVHGKAMGADEAKLTKKKLGIPLEPLFDIPKDVSDFFKKRLKEGQEYESNWQRKYGDIVPPNKTVPETFYNDLEAVDIKPNAATRVASHAVLQFIHDQLPYVIGGSADLSCSDNSLMKASTVVKPGDYSGRNIKYGVREFAMGAMSSGLALQGMILPYCATFFMFSDYMRNAIRLAALMNLKVIYQFTHDSVFLGEDGPTHQPVEHLTSLRAMPNLTVIRPADATETKGAWAAALQCEGPVALIFSRQSIQDQEETRFDLTAKGAYILKKETKKEIDYCILATGAEVGLAHEVADKLESQGKSVRLVSFPSFELFEKQSDTYKQSVLSGKQFVSIEAQSSLCWYKYIGKDGIAISIDSFGLSAPQKDLETHFGFTVEQIIQKIK